ncbi:urease accessory protein UreD [Catellatospora citrea]|uniref:Urease accessory protein UreD n=1 Tax=Catellatospora citrea TaxID=53366 RepID=A0A8J3NXC6_9ACTN|nr:urease accessory protein UreD [Catellatospora citrea]RKE12587.1 urease accessory protein [Catellatospora citrea]GIF96177.1 urease accessory protein UreD [Catellatospora citrea]
MRALARIVAEADGRGGTRLARLRGEPPLQLRHTPDGSATATVHLIGSAAGPLGGDDLRIEIEVGEGAALCVRSVAASIALPGRDGTASRMTVTATVAAGGELRWLPEQLVAAAGCRHQATSTVELSGGARLWWREELICGRHDERPGDAVVSTAVDYDGGPLLRQSLTIGPGTPGWDGPAVLGGARATGSLLLVDPHSPPRPPAVLADTAVRMPLTGPATLITATGPDAHTLRRYLDM